MPTHSRQSHISPQAIAIVIAITLVGCSGGQQAQVEEATPIPTTEANTPEAPPEVAPAPPAKVETPVNEVKDETGVKATTESDKPEEKETPKVPETAPASKDKEPAKTGGFSRGPYKLTLAGGSKGAVRFPHRMHQADYGCRRCHHQMEKGAAGRKTAPDPCSDCHSADDDPSAKQVYHKKCRGCHKSEGGGPEGCFDCHKRIFKKKS